MGEQRFPCIKYATELRDKTRERIEELDDDLMVKKAGTPEPESSWVTLKRIKDGDPEVLFMLLMNADHRYADSFEQYKTRPNYEFYHDEYQEHKFNEYQRIDAARQKWFELLEQKTTDSGSNHELGDFG